MEGCIFCGIAEGRVPSEQIYSDERTVAFRDIDPKAPVHVIIIPKRHIAKIEDASDMSVFADVFNAVGKVVSSLGLKDGYRVVANSGKLGGQAVDHIHFHLLSGRQLDWPPG